MKFPKHKCELSLTHNQPRSNYQTVAEAVADDERQSEESRYYNWVSAEQRQKSIDTNEIWVLHWYPETPVGFYVLCAADLDELLAAALESDED